MMRRLFHWTRPPSREERKRTLRRRAFLGGLGAVVALPLMESFIGDEAYADDNFPARTLFFYVPNGIHMADWTPAATGADYTLSPILQSLEMVKDSVLVLSGLSNAPAKPDGAGDHAGGTSGFLTCAHANKSETEIQLGVSIDQVIANAIGEETRIASMQLGIDGGGSTGGCDSGYSCAYTRNISWASASQWLPKTTSPTVVFNQIFDGVDGGASEEEKARRKLYRLSVLDYVREEAIALQKKLSYADKLKLDEYLTAVSDLETRLNKPAPSCEVPGGPDENPALEDHIRIMSDLMVLAMRCDATRVLSFMLANAGSNRSYGFIGVSGAHHELSHHGGDAAKQASLSTIDTWEVTQLAYLLERMAEVTEGTGTLLEHSQVFFSSEIEDGNSHAHRNLPVLLAGNCHGFYDTGRHVHYNPSNQGDGPPIANLYIQMAAAAGVDIQSFGENSTGALDQLT
jgi:hypothetical protein